MKLLKFGDPLCSACQALEASGVVERFAQVHPEIEIRHLAYGKRADALATKYKVTLVPDLLFVEGEQILARHTGSSVTFPGLEKLYASAARRLKK